LDVAHGSQKGYVRQVIVSHDTARRSRLRANGGHGYGYILREFVPKLREAGLSEADMETITVENPPRLLAFGARD
jgi:phosphotriesterase-related protein